MVPSQLRSLCEYSFVHLCRRIRRDRGSGAHSQSGGSAECLHISHLSFFTIYLMDRFSEKTAGGGQTGIYTVKSADRRIRQI